MGHIIIWAYEHIVDAWGSRLVYIVYTASCISGTLDPLIKDPHASDTFRNAHFTPRVE